MDKAPIIISFAMLCMAIISRCVSISNIVMNARLLAMALNPFRLECAESYSC
ncbi:MAG: hypothetical protein PHH26_04755 [Candidatus Thermoplasmatota archaeon]|nr:hypothetical protein [Candidatus Thermoplasmatota archaeon]